MAQNRHYYNMRKIDYSGTGVLKGIVLGEKLQVDEQQKSKKCESCSELALIRKGQKLGIREQ